MWIYNYLRADGEEIDMGPFENSSAAETARQKHEDMGALTAGPFEKTDDYILYKGLDFDSIL